jgi:hypothetical protein
LTKFQWWKFEPHPEWVKSDRDQIEWGDWIWSGRDGDAARNAPAQKRTFTKTITMPPDVKVASAIVQITADDQFEAFLNGTRIGGSDGGNESWRRPVKLDLAPALKPGENVLKIDAENVAANVPNNPAGLLVGGAVKLIDGTSIPLLSDGSWSDAKTIAKYGDGPWGRVGGDQGAIPAAAAGIPDQVRVIYVPAAMRIRVTQLKPDAGWKAEHFSPATGVTSAGPALAIEADGSAIVSPPADALDWVLVLQR